MTSKEITIEKIARLVRVDPRRARARLRKAIAAKKKVPQTLKDTRWVWRLKDVERVKKLIKA